MKTEIPPPIMGAGYYVILFIVFVAPRKWQLARSECRSLRYTSAAVFKVAYALISPLRKRSRK